MINNEMRTVSLLSYASTIDAYGQVRKGTSTSTNIEMMVKTYSQSNVDNPKYVDVELVGLTKANVSVENRIVIDTIKYDVLFVTKAKRYNEVMLRKTSL